METAEQAQPEQPVPPPPKAKRRKARIRAKDKEALAKYAEKTLLTTGPEILEKFAAQLLAGVKAGEKNAMEMVERMFYGYKGPGGVSILNQTVNLNGAAQGFKPRGTESIIRDFEERDRVNRLLPEPTPIRTASQILDAEEI